MNASVRTDEGFYLRIRDYVERRRRFLVLADRQRVQRESGLMSLNTGCGWCLMQMCVKVLREKDKEEGGSGEADNQG